MVLARSWKTSALTSSLLSVRTKDSLLPVETVMQGSRHEEVRKDNGTVIWLLQKQDQKEIITLGFLLEREIHISIKNNRLGDFFKVFSNSLKEGGGGGGAKPPQWDRDPLYLHTFPVSCFTNWSWKFPYWHWHPAFSYFSWSAKKGDKNGRVAVPESIPIQLTIFLWL